MNQQIQVKDRPTARVLLVNDLEQVFLINTHFDPELGLEPRWLTPGGGIDAGESVQEAAARELFEETGLKVSLDDLGPIFWETAGRWDWADGIHFQTYTDTIFRLQVSDFALDDSLWTPEEHRDILESRWWSVSELIASGERVGPHGLAEHLRLHLKS
jgi:8-oxo-dGTP pyrophosphatase MutT (NUDIX family)